jgi:Xaa-Pro aminopeptidase
VSDPRPARLAALGEALTRAHLDGLLVTSLPNIRYLTGFTGSSALLFVSHRDVLFATDFRYDTQVKAEVGDLARISIESQSLWTGIFRMLEQASPVQVVGFEAAHLVHRDFQRLADVGARWTWRPADELVESLRERKDADEVALIREAGRIATTALDATLTQVRAGMSELEVAGTLEKALRDAGSEWYPFPTIIASGERSALPHARSSARRIAPGDFLLLDFGATHEGYVSDVTRTVVVGRADERQREVHALVREANERAVRGVRAGMRGREADAIARELLDEHGYGKAFGHGLGHGIGLEVHEAPRLGRTSEGVLPEGAVVTIEPGIYEPGWGGVRIEDDVHLGPDGAELLTHFTRELLELA